MTVLVPALLCGLAVVTVRPRTIAPPRPRRRGPVRARKRLRRATDIDLGVLALEVATRLRSGMSVERSWDLTLTRHGVPVTYPVLDDEGRPRALVELDSRSGLVATLTDIVLGRPRLTALTRVALPMLLAASVVTHRTGAPMADVLDECAEGLTEAGEAHSARNIALSGPKSTAMMLAWLPVLGVFLGTAMGADPLGFLTGHPLGRLCLLLGVLLEVGGLVWVRKLVTSTQAEGMVGS